MKKQGRRNGLEQGVPRDCAYRQPLMTGVRMLPGCLELTAQIHACNFYALSERTSSMHWNTELESSILTGLA